MVFPKWTAVAHDAELSEYLETFPSWVTTAYPANNEVPLHVFLPAKPAGPTPCVLILHYWGAVDLTLERRLAYSLAHRAIASAIMELPYHLGRTPPGSRSGKMAIQADPTRLVETMTQSVVDVRRSIDFLSTVPGIDSRQFGVSGTSLGALVAALSYAVEPRLKRAAFLLGGVDLASIVWHSSRVVGEREKLRKAGYSENSLRDALRPIEIGAFLRARPPQTAFVIGAKYDTVIPRSSTDGLINDLPGCKTLWLDTGHYGGVFIQRRILSEVAGFFEAEFAGMPYEPPKRISAPTLRIGAEVATGFGFEIVAGLDLVRPRGRGSVFLSVFGSPRGPRLFLGSSIDQGWSAGVVARPRGVGFAVLWSTVL